MSENVTQKSLQDCFVRALSGIEITFKRNISHGDLPIFEEINERKPLDITVAFGGKN